MARRPDLLIGQIFADVSAQEALLVEALLMWMLFTEDGGMAVSPLRESLARLLMAHGEAWHSVYDKFRESEGQNEQAGYTVAPCDYRSKEIPAPGRKEGRADNESLAHELVTEALSTHSPEICHTLYYILARIDCQKGHIYQGGAKPSAEAEKTDRQDDECPGQLTNRQVVIMMTALMGISLSPEYTNQQLLGRMLGRLTGRSAESLRKTIGKLAKEGIETDEARKDARVAADALEPFCSRIADRIRNDAEDS